MSIDNRDLNELLETTINVGKPWYKRWWVKLKYNLSILAKLSLIIFIGFCIGKFMVDHPIIFATLVAALG